MDLTALSIEDLTDLVASAQKELAARRRQQPLALYTCNCKDSAKYHLGKYKHWAKLVTSVDTTKTNGYAFGGDFLAVAREHKIPVGSVVVETCGTDIHCYRAAQDGKVEIASGSCRSMSSFIDKVAALF